MSGEDTRRQVRDLERRLAAAERQLQAVGGQRRANARVRYRSSCMFKGLSLVDSAGSASAFSSNKVSANQTGYFYYTHDDATNNNVGDQAATGIVATIPSASELWSLRFTQSAMFKITMDVLVVLPSEIVAINGNWRTIFQITPYRITDSTTKAIRRGFVYGRCIGSSQRCSVFTRSYIANFNDGDRMRIQTGEILYEYETGGLGAYTSSTKSLQILDSHLIVDNIGAQIDEYYSGTAWEDSDVG